MSQHSALPRDRASSILPQDAVLEHCQRGEGDPSPRKHKAEALVSEWSNSGAGNPESS